MEKSKNIPQAFILRRLHSLMGLWLVIFMIQHLLTNSQAALFFGDDGAGFIHSVNAIHELPFLPLIEIAILGTPILLHLIWGIKYIKSAEYNSSKSDGSTPYLPYSRNKAYTWQRITAWLLTVLLIGHVVQMRFMQYPNSAQIKTKSDTKSFYFYPVSVDEGLYTVAERLNVDLYDGEEIERMKKDWERETDSLSLKPTSNHFFQKSQIFNQKTQEESIVWQKTEQRKAFLNAIQKWPLESTQVMTVSKNFGTAELMMLRDTFKSPWMLVLYTVLILTACFHAFNGLWTFLIKWGVTLTERSQKMMLILAKGLMCVVAFLGLVAVWGTYWINLKY